MYCPKCGQQQANDEMRFCSRCGFQLAVVTSLIATGGVPPAIIVSTNEVESRKELKRRSRQGAKLMFVSGVVAPVAMGFGILFESPLPLLIPFTIFLAGLALMLYFRWFGEDVSLMGHIPSPSQFGAMDQNLLPSGQSQIETDFGKRPRRTAEIVQPPSVTEHTTKLLDADERKT